MSRRFGMAAVAGLDADGLSVRLGGVQSVTTVYTGDANPLGAPRGTSGYDAASGSYVLDLGANAVTVAPGDVVRVGLCAPTAVTGARMQWLGGAAALGDPVPMPAVTWNWPALDAIQIRVKNTAATPMTLLDLRLLAVETEPSADDLEGAATANLATGGAALEEPVLLDPNAVLSLQLPLDPEGPAPGAPIAMAIEWAADDDLAAAGTAYVVAGVPDALYTYLPALSR